MAPMPAGKPAQPAGPQSLQTLQSLQRHDLRGAAPPPESLAAVAAVSNTRLTPSPTPPLLPSDSPTRGANGMAQQRQRSGFKAAAAAGAATAASLPLAASFGTLGARRSHEEPPHPGASYEQRREFWRQFATPGEEAGGEGAAAAAAGAGAHANGALASEAAAGAENGRYAASEGASSGTSWSSGEATL